MNSNVYSISMPVSIGRKIGYSGQACTSDESAFYYGMAISHDFALSKATQNVFENFWKAAVHKNAIKVFLFFFPNSDQLWIIQLKSDLALGHPSNHSLSTKYRMTTWNILAITSFNWAVVAIQDQKPRGIEENFGKLSILNAIKSIHSLKMI